MKKNKIVWARASDGCGIGSGYDFFIKQQSEFREDTPLRTVLKSLRTRDIKVFELRQEKGFWWYTVKESVKSL